MPMKSRMPASNLSFSSSQDEYCWDSMIGSSSGRTRSCQLRLAVELPVLVA